MKNNTLSNNLMQDIKSDKIMNKQITKEECKTLLESIFNNAIENGEGFQIENNHLTIGEYRAKGEVKVAILTSEKYLPQIYIDKDYSVLEEETEHVCVVPFDELLSWDRMSDTHPFSEEYEGDLEEDELCLSEVNNIIGKLLLFYRQFNGDWDFTWEKFLKDINTYDEDRGCKTEISYRSEKEIGDDEEVYILCYDHACDNKIEVEPFRNREDMISLLYAYWDGTGYVKAKWGDVKNSL